MIVKTPGSQKGSPAAAEERAEGRGGGRGEGGERRRVQARSKLESTAQKVRSRSKEGVSLNAAQRIVIVIWSSQRSRVQRHARLQLRHSRVHQSPYCQHQRQMRDGEPKLRGLKRRYDMMFRTAANWVSFDFNVSYSSG